MRISSSKCAEYIGSIEIRRVSYAQRGGGGGRGLFAREPIKAHSLILVSNAMAAATRDPTDLRVIFDGPPRDFDPVLVQLIQRAARSKRSMAQLYSLASGQTEKMEVPSMELFELGSQWTPPSANTLEVDVNFLIKKIIEVNSFGIHSEQGIPISTSLWILISFMNHSCIPNCLALSSGSVMFVSAARDIEADEELTISYFPKLFAGLDTRQEQAQRQRFRCECERCHLEERLEPEFSEIRSRVRLLVSASKDEVDNDVVSYMATARAVRQSQGKRRSSKGKKGNCSLDNQERGWEGWSATSKLHVATRQLAQLAEQVETLISSLDGRVTTHQRKWVRASFLEAYLAKHVLEAVSKPDATAGIEILSLIVEAMMSIIPNDSTLILAQFLFDEVKEHYGKKSRTYKAIENLNLRVIRSLEHENWLRLQLIMLTSL